MTDSSLSMGMASLSDVLKITVIPPDATMNGAVFLEIMQESGSALQEGDNLITAIANHPRIAEAIPLIDRERKGSQGLATRRANLQAFAPKFVYRLTRPCHICGKHSVETTVSWPIVREMLRSGADVSRFLDRRTTDDAVRYYSHRIYDIANRTPDYIAPFSDFCDHYLVCATCWPTIAYLASQQKMLDDARRNEKQRQQREREEEERRIEEERIPYRIVSHPSTDPAGFSTVCSDLVRQGYRAWGQPQIDPQGNLVQAFQRQVSQGSRPKRQDPREPIQGSSGPDECPF